MQSLIRDNTKHAALNHHTSRRGEITEMLFSSTLKPLVKSRQVQGLQHRSGDDNPCNVVVPWVSQVGGKVLEGARSWICNSLDNEAQESHECEPS